jgi:hypothetical protein
MTYYNFNLSKHANYIKLASELLAQKGWPRYYAVGYYSEDFGDEVCDFNVPFTEEQYNEVRAIIEECKAKDIDLWDYFDGENYPEFLRLDEPGFHSDPRTINLDMAGYPCKIKMAIFYDGIDKAPQVIERVIVLSYDEFHELLVWQLMHRRSNYNDLHEDRPQLFKAVDEKIRMIFSSDDGGIMPFTVPLFAVELIDIKEEAFQLCGEADIERDIFNHSYEEIAERSFVGIDDRKMMFCYECFNYEKGRTSEILVLDDIDAIAVEQALGVDSYAGIVDSLSVYFGERDGVARFAEFLRSKSIDFVEKDRH